MNLFQGSSDFEYGHTVDADTIRISTIVQAADGIDENGVRNSHRKY